ncbi:MAG: phage tail tape measure C-terminal domain-containing protein [Oceanicaulis sp.]
MTDAERKAERFAALAEEKRKLQETAETGEESAGAIGEAFAAAGRDIADTLQAAARSGELSFRSMAEQITQSLAAILIEQTLVEPLTRLAERFGPPLGDAFPNILGQRAEGGPVGAGSTYLVGERGPELFTPGQAGAISPIASAAPVNVTIYAGADAADSVRRSQRQIAAAVARAALAGRSSL